MEVAQRTAEPVAAGGAGKKPSDDCLRKVVEWFSVEKETITRATKADVELAAGGGPGADSWWGKALGLFMSIKGEIKYASTREHQVVSYRLSRLDDLIKAANCLLCECNKLMREATGCDWLFIGEDFDKAGIAPKQTEDLFVSYSNVLRDLDAHLIFNIPISLGYAPKAVSLPVPNHLIFCVPDTMVFHRDHFPHLKGRAAVEAVLEARIDPVLFGPNQMMRLIVASGGNLRNLFSLTNNAADTALLRGASQIGADDVTISIRQLRTDYERQLGESPYDLETSTDGKPRPLSYEQKALRLLRIYRQEATAKVPDPILYSLLRSRAVQEFNGERWFGVHPLIVDILVAQGKIDRPNGQGVPGGTEIE